TLPSGHVFALRMGYCRCTVRTCVAWEGTSAERGFWGTRVRVPLFPTTSYPLWHIRCFCIAFLGRLVIGIGPSRVVGRVNDLADLRKCLPNGLLASLIERHTDHAAPLAAATESDIDHIASYINEFNLSPVRRHARI